MTIYIPTLKKFNSCHPHNYKKEKIFSRICFIVLLLIVKHDIWHHVQSSKYSVHIPNNVHSQIANDKINQHRPNLYSFSAVQAFDDDERIQLRDEAKQMFYHAYNSYISKYPADEILPISCKGRYRLGQENSEIDDSIGNFSLTLVDSLDMLVVLGDIDEFNSALKKVVRDLDFDADIVVSVFETNIRMLGGLLSAHILAKSLQSDNDRNIRNINSFARQQLKWYDSEMLDLAEDLGKRLLPAFHTKTGIPHPRVNLRHGMKFKSSKPIDETCTACAGSLILEFGTLSRLTGNPIFEQKARKALDSIWNYRHKSNNLVGTVLNVDNGEWVRGESGVGAGSDSYYEYLLKAYILLGDETYLDRFNAHYKSVMNYISRGPFLIDVHMNRPHRVAKGFMDALSAFWPGLQVLKGDLRSAISIHSMFNEVIRRHRYLPEAFTPDLQVYWANHQIRPEFLESTYFLHRATNDDYYLETGRSILKKLQSLKVSCGFAGLKDVRTGVHDDKMASFVLAETLKYLYLLFNNDNETHIDFDRFIFSTEGHILPLDLSLKQVLLLDDESISDETLEPKLIQATKKDGKSKKTNDSAPPKSSITSLLRQISENIQTTKSICSGIKQQEKSVIMATIYKSSDYYSNSCPSLEVEDIRFNTLYHPFLYRDSNGLSVDDEPVDIGLVANRNSVDKQSEYIQLDKAKYLELVERLHSFKLSDEYLSGDSEKLADSLGLSLKIQRNGALSFTLSQKTTDLEDIDKTDRKKDAFSGEFDEL